MEYSPAAWRRASPAPGKPPRNGARPEPAARSTSAAPGRAPCPATIPAVHPGAVPVPGRLRGGVQKAAVVGAPGSALLGVQNVGSKGVHKEHLARSPGRRAENPEDVRLQGYEIVLGDSKQGSSGLTRDRETIELSRKRDDSLTST